MMLGLKTARVLVLDDNFDEARPIIESLSLAGVGCLYHDGDIGSHESNGQNLLHGIRVAFVDLNLKPDLREENAAMAKRCVDVLKKVLDQDDNPLFVVLWTKEEEAATILRSDLPNALSTRPVRVINLDNKSDFVEYFSGSQHDKGEKTEKARELIRFIEDHIYRIQPLIIIHAW